VLHRAACSEVHVTACSKNLGLRHFQKKKNSAISACCLALTSTDYYLFFFSYVFIFLHLSALTNYQLTYLWHCGSNLKNKLPESCQSLLGVFFFFEKWRRPRFSEHTVMEFKKKKNLMHQILGLIGLYNKCA
jgi:hypothetical protein